MSGHYLNNFRGFKKTSEDKHSATLEHSDGHKIVIAKSALSGQMQQSLSAIPIHKKGKDKVQKFEDGGEVAPESLRPDSPSPAPDPANEMLSFNPNAPAPEGMTDTSPQSLINQIKDPGYAMKSAGMVGPAASEEVPVARAPVSNYSLGPSKPGGEFMFPQMNADDMLAGNAMQQRGVMNEAAAQGKLAQAQQPLYKTEAEFQENLMKNVQANTMKNDAEIRGIIDDYKNGHIDPNHYINSMGAGSKTATAIGLLLGGMGGGLTHQENPALKLLQQNIENDVNAQKFDSERKQNVYTALQKQFGNNIDASKMLGALSAQHTATRIQEEAAKIGTPLAVARAQQIVGPLMQQAQQMKLEVGMRQAALGQIKAGVPTPAVIPFLVPQHAQKQATDAYSSIDETNKIQGNLQGAFNDIHGKFMNGVLSPNDVESAKTAFAGPISKASAGRFTEYDAKVQMNAFLPKPTDSKQTVINKQKRMGQFFDEMRAPHATYLRQYGIPTPQPAPVFKKKEQ